MSETGERISDGKIENFIKYFIDFENGRRIIYTAITELKKYDSTHTGSLVDRLKTNHTKYSEWVTKIETLVTNLSNDINTIKSLNSAIKDWGETHDKWTATISIKDATSIISGGMTPLSGAISNGIVKKFE